MGKVVQAAARFRHKGLTETFLLNELSTEKEHRVRIAKLQEDALKQEVYRFLEEMKLAEDNRAQAKGWFERFSKGANELSRPKT